MAHHPRPRRTAALLVAACCALTAACSPLGGAAEPATAAAPLSTAVPPAGPSVVLGSGVARPTPVPPAPAPTVTEEVVTFVTVTATPRPTVTAEPEPVETCGDVANRRVVDIAATATGPGTAEVRWRSRKASSLLGWRVAAVPQDLVLGAQPPLVWQNVAAPAGCQDAAATFTGLTSGGRYQFWLHAMVSSPVDPGPTAEMVGRSPVVTVP